VNADIKKSWHENNKCIYDIGYNGAPVQCTCKEFKEKKKNNEKKGNNENNN